MVVKTLIISVVAGAVLVVIAARALASRAARKTGWRVGHVGRDGMYYEEFVDARWQRLDIDGEMLVGPAHYVIYFASEEQWASYPAWARDRRAQIVCRIKAAFSPPHYEHHGA